MYLMSPERSGLARCGGRAAAGRRPARDKKCSKNCGKKCWLIARESLTLPQKHWGKTGGDGETYGQAAHAISTARIST